MTGILSYCRQFGMGYGRFVDEPMWLNQLSRTEGGSVELGNSRIGLGGLGRGEIHCFEIKENWLFGNSYGQFLQLTVIGSLEFDHDAQSTHFI